jgi:FixJ family two-component response regulator
MPAGVDGLVSVVSSDAAVRRSLVLLLEAEGLTARAFCTLPTLLDVMDVAPGPTRHCLVIEERQARRLDTKALAGRVRRDGNRVPIVVLTGERPPAPSQGDISFVDPFGVDDVLHTIRDALNEP